MDKKKLKKVAIIIAIGLLALLVAKLAFPLIIFAFVVYVASIIIKKL